MTLIQSLQALEILDSRGNPTVMVTAKSDDYEATAMVPSGASTGTHEAVELRDGDKGRYDGNGVLTAVKHVNGELNDELSGFDVFDQGGLDRRMIELDGTENKGRLGANAILGVSLAAARLAAKEKGVELFEWLAAISETEEVSLPFPMMNVINGGAHADNTLDFQEFMFFPFGAHLISTPSEMKISFSDRLRAGVECFHSLKEILQERNLSTAVGDEGGFAPDLRTHEDALSLMMEAAKTAGYGDSMQLTMDPAASKFYDKDKGCYVIEGEETGTDKLIDYYAYLCDKYPIVSLEDPLFEDDWEGWVKLTAKLGDTVQIVGDDLLVTNVGRIQKAIELKACNSVLIKVNQIGTLTEAIEAIKCARDSGLTAVVSHRSGDTEDTFIADLSVGLATEQIKTGSLSRSERIAKYNRLLVIEELLG
jgi:enolase